MSTTEDETPLTPLPTYLGHDAFLVTSTRLPGMPPVLTSAVEEFPEDVPQPWRPYFDDEEAG